MTKEDLKAKKTAKIKMAAFIQTLHNFVLWSWLGDTSLAEKVLIIWYWGTHTNTHTFLSFWSEEADLMMLKCVIKPIKQFYTLSNLLTDILKCLIILSTRFQKQVFSSNFIPRVIDTHNIYVCVLYRFRYTHTNMYIHIFLYICMSKHEEKLTPKTSSPWKWLKKWLEVVGPMKIMENFCTSLLLQNGWNIRVLEKLNEKN